MCGKQLLPKDESLELIMDLDKKVGNELRSISFNMSSAETVRRLNIYKPEGGLLKTSSLLRSECFLSELIK